MHEGFNTLDEDEVIGGAMDDTAEDADMDDEVEDGEDEALGAVEEEEEM